MNRLHQLARLRHRIGDTLRDDMEIELAEPGGKLVEAVGRRADLEILVLAPLPTEKEIDRPAGGDVPGHVDPGQPSRRILRAPCVPLGVVRMHASHPTRGARTG